MNFLVPNPALIQNLHKFHGYKQEVSPSDIQNHGYQTGIKVIDQDFAYQGFNSDAELYKHTCKIKKKGGGELNSKIFKPKDTRQETLWIVQDYVY